MSDEEELRIKRKPGTIHIVVTAVMGGLTAVIGFLTHNFLPHLIITPWPTVGLFAAAGVWFGAWGVLASYIGNTIASVSALGLLVGAVQSISALFQALIPAWAFRYFKVDPTLKTSRDLTMFMIFANIIPSFVSTLTGPTFWYLLPPYLIPNLTALLWIMPAWFLSNAIMVPVIAIPLMKATSATIMRSRAYVIKWLA